MSTTKNAQPYYPHNANSRNEDNMIRLRLVHGVAGYGVYHMLLERLRMSDDYKCDLDYDILSWDLACDEDLIRSVIYDFGLFEIADEGQSFCSVELNAYMQLMAEKKRERQERARAAAQARWGINVDETPDSREVSQPEIPLETQETPAELKETTGKESERLDKEIAGIKEDKEWLVTMSAESGKSEEEILSYLPDFRSMCVLRGLKGGHKDMKDTFSHFRSWIYRSGRAKDPKASQSDQKSRSVRCKTSDAENRAQREKETAIRMARYAENERTKHSPDDYIRSLGYDPSVVRLKQVMNPNWCINNPPTHPEWIVERKSTKVQTLEVPY